MPGHALYAGGLELKFFPTANFESVEGEQNAAAIARNALRILMMGWRDDWRQLSSWRLFRAVFITRDRELLRGMRKAFQEGFDNLYQQLEKSALNRPQRRQAQLYLSNCMSLLPYSDLTPYESISIPQYINHRWQMIEYKITAIELTARKGFAALALQDQDRVFAYGLEPIFNHHSTPHLIFMGTTYPAGQGFISQVETDLQGFKTPGHGLYLNGRERLRKWLQNQNQKAHVCGVSLGGSLSLLLAMDLGELICRVDALNPAGLHQFKSERYDRWDAIKFKPEVIIQQQGADPVSRFGVWKRDWIFLHVKPPVEKQGPNGLADHPMNYAGFAQTKFKALDIDRENQKNKHRNFWIYSLGRGMVYYTAVLPVRYVIRPFLHYCLTHKKILMLDLLQVLATTAVSAGLGFLLGGPMGAVFGLGISLTVNMAFLSCIKIKYIKNIKKEPLAAIHDPGLPRVATLDLYDNRVDARFSYAQLNTYYRATRCLLKGKNFSASKTPAQDFYGLSKNELLVRAADSSMAKKTVKMNLSKAKYHHMHSTLHMVARFGFENGESLKNNLAREYRLYKTGKREQLHQPASSIDLNSQ